MCNLWTLLSAAAERWRVTKKTIVNRTHPPTTAAMIAMDELPPPLEPLEASVDDDGAAVG